MDVLEENRNERGMANWDKMGVPGMTSYGIGLTVLKKLTKGFPKDHDLAKELLATNNYEARQVACLLMNPKLLSQADLEEIMNSMHFWMLCHVFIQNVLGKHPQKKDFLDNWKDDKDDMKRRCAYGIIYYLVKDKKVDDDYFLALVDTIESNLQKEENFVKDQMNTALFAMGQRSAELYARCLAAAKNIGAVHVDYGDNSCQALDVVKHLEGDRIRAKFA